MVLSVLKRRKTGFSDAELAEATGIKYVAPIRSKLTKAGLVVQAGARKGAHRTVRTYRAV